MDIGAVGILSWIASSTNQSLITYDPIFLMIGGLMLAFGVIAAIIGFLPGSRSGEIEGMDLDDTIEI